MLDIVHSWGGGRRIRLAAPALLLVVLLPAVPARAADDGTGLSLLSLTRTSTAATAVVVAPYSPGEADRSGSGFRVEVDGTAKPVTAAHTISEALQLVAVLDATVGAAQLAVQAGALRELVLNLPPPARVGVVVLDPGPRVLSPVVADRATVLRALAGLAGARSGPGAEGGLGAGLQTGLSLFDAGSPDHLLLVPQVVAARPAPAATVRTTLLSERARVFGCVTGTGPAGVALADLAETSQGWSDPVPPSALLACHDQVLRQVLGRYQLRFPVGPRGGLATVTVTGQPGTPAYGVVPAAAGAPTRIGRSGSHLPRTPALVALLLLVVLEAGLVALVLRRRRAAPDRP